MQTGSVFVVAAAMLALGAAGGAWWAQRPAAGPAAAAVAAGAGAATGYGTAQTVTYAWLSQALIAPIQVFQWPELALRVRSGEIAVDLTRPVDLQLSWLAMDLGRAAYSILPRGLPPLLIGAVITGLALPRAVLPYLLGAVSVLLAVVISFACRFLVSLAAFWVVEVRGVIGSYVTISNLLCGLMLPVSWFPGWLRTLAAGTPFPSMLQAPVDVITGRTGTVQSLETLAVQAFWAAGVLLAGRWALRRGQRRLVVQGG